MLLFDKLLFIDEQPRGRTVKKKTSPMQTQMAPKISGGEPVSTNGFHRPIPKYKIRRSVLHSSPSDEVFDFDEPISSVVSSTKSSPVTATPHPQEPNLFTIPEGLYPTYKPLGKINQLALGFLSTASATFLTWSFSKYESPLLIVLRWMNVLKSASLVDLYSMIPWGKLLLCAVRTIVFLTVSRTLCQEAFFRPSRVSTGELQERFHLPSKFSQYRPIELKGDFRSDSFGVHWLEYKNPDRIRRSQGMFQADALYFNHGFGASSLSWLPVLPRLTKLTGARIGLAHDAVGFGFTDRPGKESDGGSSDSSDYLEYYRMNGSAAIASSLLQEKLLEHRDSDAVENHDDNKAKSVLLFGHSMGSMTTLRMALKLKEEFSDKGIPLKIRIVLVAPALGFSRVHKMSRSVSTELRHRVKYVGKRIVYPVLDSFGRFALRRVVGTPNFWRKGLSQVWGDPDKVTESDVLRFQWPSVGQGWEQGLLNFAKAQTTLSKQDPPEFDDKALLRSVLDLPEVEGVDVIVADKDRIVPAKIVKKFLQNDFPAVRIAEIEGQGHDPFEEDVEGFLKTIEKILS